MDPYIEPIFDSFYATLKSLGYTGPTLPIEKVDHYNESTDITTDGYKCNFVHQFSFYNNKASYLFSDFIAINQKVSKHSAVIASTTNLMYNLKFKEAPDIPMVEYRWWVEPHGKMTNEIPKDTRVNMMKKIIVCFKSWLNPELVEIGTRVKVPGAIVIAYPKGKKDPSNPIAEMGIIGRRQREALAVRYGFSRPKSDGYVYGVFDENLKIVPLD